MKQKGVLAIHDISCFGRCSLTVALPIISAAGVQCTVLPTAVLSTHTGGFTGYTFRDLTCDMEPVTEHWKTLSLDFNAVYTGFLGSFEQIDIVSKIFDDLSAKGTKVVVDPVMADGGKLYPIFPDTFPQGMARLCKKADVILPNITEACLMTGIPYKEGPYTEDWIMALLESLGELGPGTVILTGISYDAENVGAAAYNTATKSVSYAFHKLIPGYYHGTGDVFGSVITAALMVGKTSAEAVRIAVDFTCSSIERTVALGEDIRFGVDFEEGIPTLLKDLGA